MTEPVASLATRFVAAIAAGDLDGIRAIYAPDARIWHNFDGLDYPGQTVEENLKTLGWMRRVLKDIRYEVKRLEPTTSGFVQQHVLHGVTTLGERVAMPACIVCVVHGGHITRLEEYLDPAQAAPLTRAAEAARKQA
jgi:ketosteroid isomerase-like protein